MSEEYQMSMMGELKFFLGLQIRQQRNGIFMSQEKYLKDVLRKFSMQDCKGIKIPMPTNGHLCTNENGIDFDQKVLSGGRCDIFQRVAYHCGSQ